MKLAIVADGQGSNRIHAQGCKDIAAEQKAYKNKALRVEITSVQELAEKLWGDVAKNTTEPGTPEYTTLSRELFGASDTICDCVQGLPETDADAEPAYGTIATNTRNKHFLKEDGEGVKTACGKAVKSVERGAEVTKRTMCTLCTKAQEQGAQIVLVDAIDWADPQHRLARVSQPAAKRVEVPGLGVSVPVKEETAAAPKQTARQRASAKAAAKVAAAKPVEPKAEPKAQPVKAAKKTAAPAKSKVVAADGVDVTAQAMYDWLDDAAQRGAISKSQRSSYRTVTPKLMALLPDGMKTDVFDLDIEVVAAAFRQAEPTKSPITHKVYPGDLRKCIEFYAAYAQDPKGWAKQHPAKPAK